MSIIALEDAKAHLRADGDDDALIQAYLDAAEDASAQFLNRAIYADDAALLAARVAAPAMLATSLTDIETRVTAAGDIEDGTQQCEALAVIETDRRNALNAYREAMAGVVINASITAACLLMLGKLYANREDVVTGQTAVELPQGAHSLLWPYRVGLGV